MRVLTDVELEAASGGVMYDNGYTCREVSWAEYLLLNMLNSMGTDGYDYGSP